MPAPAHSTKPQSETAENARPDDGWYRANSLTTDNVEPQPAIPAVPSRDTNFPDPLDTLTSADIPGPHMRRDSATVPTLLNLQHAELDRLVRDNERLMDRIETLLQIQSREQVLRQQLQNQADRIGEQMKLPISPSTLDAVRKEARAGVTEEIKPVLMAILDALERFTSKSETKVSAASSAEPTDPYLGEDYGKLPAILTRPLTELMDDGRAPVHPDSEMANRRPRKSPFRKRKHTRTAKVGAPIGAQEETDGSTPFTWTTVFSS
jgi:hypothetical protein